MECPCSDGRCQRSASERSVVGVAVEEVVFVSVIWVNQKRDEDSTSWPSPAALSWGLVIVLQALGLTTAVLGAPAGTSLLTAKGGSCTCLDVCNDFTPGIVTSSKGNVSITEHQLIPNAGSYREWYRGR